MKISFDLDGVIANSEPWFFLLCEAIGKEKKVIMDAQRKYYSTRPLRQHPNLLMTEDDEGFIITARKSDSQLLTKLWLSRHSIYLPVYFLEGADDVDWTFYLSASREVASMKANIIRKLGVELHFDNNPHLVRILRVMLPDVKVVQVGGEVG